MRLAPRNSLPLTKGATLAGFAGTIASLGVPLSGYLRRASLPLHFDEMPDAWVSYEAMSNFAVDVCRREAIDDLGLRVTAWASQRALHPRLQAAFTTSPTLYDAITQVTDAAKLQSTHLRVWLEPHGTSARFCHTNDAALKVPGHDITEAYTTHQFVKLFRRFCGQDWLPRRLYARRLPPDGQRARHVTPFADQEVPLVPNDHYGGFDVPIEVLCSPNPALEAAPVSCNNSRVPATTTESLRAILGPYLLDGAPSIDTAAALFGLSRRTLQRALAAEHSNYARVLSQVRFERARIDLVDFDRPLADIALRLGYSEQSAFNRAFRSWAGMSPGAFRSSLQATERT